MVPDEQQGVDEVFKGGSHLPSSLRKQDGVLELHIKALQSFYLPIDFLLELSWTAGHYRRDKLEGKHEIRLGRWCSRCRSDTQRFHV